MTQRYAETFTAFFGAIFTAFSPGARKSHGRRHRKDQHETAKVPGNVSQAKRRGRSSIAPHRLGYTICLVAGPQPPISNMLRFARVWISDPQHGGDGSFAVGSAPPGPQPPWRD